jgi:hypothetical protein
MLLEQRIDKFGAMSAKGSKSSFFVKPDEPRKSRDVRGKYRCQSALHWHLLDQNFYREVMASATSSAMTDQRRSLVQTVNV